MLGILGGSGGQILLSLGIARIGEMGSWLFGGGICSEEYGLFAAALRGMHGVWGALR